jgi:hypothetical protein
LELQPPIESTKIAHASMDHPCDRSHDNRSGRCRSGPRPARNQHAFDGNHLSVKPGGQGAWYVMVSAAHVFDDIKGDIATINFRWKGQDDKYLQKPHEIKLREAGKALYVKHPDVDVAALYVKMPVDFKAVLLPTELLAGDDLLKQYEIHPGDELSCLGYPLFASGPHGYPILRSGKIASYPLVPTKEVKQWWFDFRVFKGNSGGPVYFVDRGRTYGNSTKVGETIQFLAGLMTSQVHAALVNNTDLQLGVVIPAVFIRETIDMLPAESIYKD